MELVGSLSKPKNNRTTLLIRDNSAAILENNTILTYRQFNEKIDSSTKSLTKLGIKRWDKVAILSENTTDYIILVFALWKLGAVPVPLNLRLLINELEELISIAGCNFLLTGKLEEEIAESHRFELTIAGIGVHKFPVEEEKAGEYSIDINTVTDSPDKFKMSNTAVIIFTSGSTGRPKGVELSFNNLFHSAFTGNKLFQHQKDDVWLASLPFYHIGGFSIITRNFFYGTTLIIPQSLKTEDLLYAIENLKPTLASLVSTQLQRLINTGCKPSPLLRHVLLGGGFIEAELVRRALEKGWNVSKSYGTTETASFVTALTPEKFKIKPDSAGKAIPPNQILIIDGNKNILDKRKTGHIAIKAQSVAKGYLNNEKDSKINFSGNIFYSGDYGYLDDDGFLFIEARREDLIVSGGENIIPLEVESEILKYPGIKEVCVFGLEDKEWGHIAAAAIVSEKEITIEELKEFLKDKLPSFKHPQKIIILDKMPRTELGKIQKGKVKERLKNLKM